MNCTDESYIFLVEFIIEQLQLFQIEKYNRRFSTNLLTTSFLWQLTSTSLYKKLKALFILPSIRRLQQLNVVNNVGQGEIHYKYLKERTVGLKTAEKTVCLMIDEVYTAQKIEYSNGSFVGLDEEGKPAKTVLTFMMQSICSKYKDVVCLLPVSQLDTSLIRLWFDK